MLEIVDGGESTSFFCFTLSCKRPNSPRPSILNTKPVNQSTVPINNQSFSGSVWKRMYKYKYNDSGHAKMPTEKSGWEMPSESCRAPLPICRKVTILHKREKIKISLFLGFNYSSPS